MKKYFPFLFLLIVFCGEGCLSASDKYLDESGKYSELSSSAYYAAKVAKTSEDFKYFDSLSRVYDSIRLVYWKKYDTATWEERKLKR